MGHFVIWVSLSFLRYLLSLAGAALIVFPLLRLALVAAFKHLPTHGPGHGIRQLIAVPVVEILGRERRARRGDEDSLLQLFVINLIFTLIISIAMQGFVISIIFTLIFVFGAYFLLGVE